MLARVAFAISFCAASVSAFQVFAPSKEIYWVVDVETNPITWNCTDPEAKSYGDMRVVLRNSTHPNYNLALFNIHNNDCHASADHYGFSVAPPPAANYTLAFMSFQNLDQVIATSEPFEIKPKGTAVSPLKPPTLGTNAAQSVKPHWALAIALGVAGAAFGVHAHH